MFVHTDYVLNGQPHGGIASGMAAVRWDPGFLRPYFDKNGDPAVTINTGRTTLVKGQQVAIREHRRIRDLVANGVYHPVFNATSLRKEEWLLLDQNILRAARYRMGAWDDLARTNAFGGFNGMSKLILEHETMSDPGEALVDMDALSEGRGDRPLFQLQGLPLPITHSDFWIPSRNLAVSRNSTTPIDATLGEASARRVGESIEKTTIGVTTGVTYGGNSTQVGGYGRTSSVYGYINFPSRVTKTNMTAPTTGGWSPTTTLNEVNACLNLLRNQKFFGPFMLYHSNDWDPYLDGDYYYALTSGAVAPTKSLRTRLREIDGIKDVKRLDFLFASQPSSSTGPGTDVDATLKPFRFIFVQQTPDVARAVIGLDITTVQWEEKGGLKLNFKIMAICVPQVRADYYGNCGVLDATTS